MIFAFILIIFIVFVGITTTMRLTRDITNESNRNLGENIAVSSLLAVGTVAGVSLILIGLAR